MELNSTKLGLAAACTSALLWLFCSALVVLLPSEMMFMSGHMVHANLESFSWTLTFMGFLVGLVAWSAIACVAGWMIGTVYNFLS